MSIYQYNVKMDNRDPMYGNTRVLKEFGWNKEGAIKWAKENGKGYGRNSDLVYVEEAEFASEGNLAKGISLCQRHVWSAAFHGYEDEINPDYRGDYEEDSTEENVIVNSLKSKILNAANKANTLNKKSVNELERS